MKVTVNYIILKREINPRFELDSDYIEELKNSNQDLDFRIFREMCLRIPQGKIAGRGNQKTQSQ